MIQPLSAPRQLMIPLLCLLLLLSGCSAEESREKPQQVQPPKVTLFSPERTETKQLFSYPGSVRASRETALSFRVGGQLVKISAYPGQSVSEGDLLMQLDVTDLGDNIRILEAELDGAEARARKAASDFSRAEELLGEDVIAQADFDLAKSSLASADAAVRNLRAQLSLAHHKLDYASLKAPYDATVTGQMVENHELVQAGQPVLRIHDIATLEIDCSVPENDIARLSLRKGMPATLQLPSQPGTNITAALAEWSTSAERATGTYRLTFRFPAPDAITVLPGMTAEVTISSATTGEMLTIPFSAVTADTRGKSAVWIYNHSTGRISLRHIRTGQLSGPDRIIVTGGLEEGEQIVAPDSHYLTEGMIVEPLTDKNKAETE
ncbi:MAG: efflux RND transporter periplasmic adaptor subunit [Prosthecochloris sp.]|nr:efflux RND transporter periplasmic adaptor subunit [Prosthecochloris sp.]